MPDILLFEIIVKKFSKYGKILLGKKNIIFLEARHTISSTSVIDYS